VVVAEGVETEAERDFLRANGCDLAQGFLYAQALPAGEFERWLGARAA
jgi:EAL domain-containing protein (putative c-di-GMP-specific phosphodiesterase class I)